jgi:hypothetical protein
LGVHILATEWVKRLRIRTLAGGQKIEPIKIEL